MQTADQHRLNPLVSAPPRLRGWISAQSRRETPLRAQREARNVSRLEAPAASQANQTTGSEGFFYTSRMRVGLFASGATGHEPHLSGRRSNGWSASRPRPSSAWAARSFRAESEETIEHPERSELAATDPSRLKPRRSFDAEGYGACSLAGARGSERRLAQISEAASPKSRSPSRQIRIWIPSSSRCCMESPSKSSLKSVW